MRKFSYSVDHSSDTAQGNVFFALQPDPPACAKIGDVIGDLCTRYGFTQPIFPDTRLHLSMHSVDLQRAVRSDVLRHVRSAGANVAAFTSCFEVHLDSAVTFETKKARTPVVLKATRPEPAITHLRDALGSALTHCGMKFRPQESFTPHVTILYEPKKIAAEPVPTVRWPATELVLIDSLTGTSTYRELGRWPFEGD